MRVFSFTIAAFLIPAVLFSDCRHEKITALTKSYADLQIDGKTPTTTYFCADSLKKLPFDSLKTKVSAAEKPVKIKAGKPVALRIPFVTQKSKSTFIPLRGKLKAYTPEKDSMLFPKTQDIKPIKVPFIENPPVKTLPMRYSENTRINLQYFNEEQQLGTSTVTSIIKDNRGDMWFGTFGAGAVRYNGKILYRYSPGVNLGAETVLTIGEDKHKNIWFGSREGTSIAMYDGKNLYRYDFETEGLTLPVSRFFEDSKGNFWLGTGLGAFLYKYNNSFIHFTSKEGLSDIIFDICEDRKGKIWFATGTDGIICMVGDRFIHYSEENGLISNHVFAVEIDHEDRLWLGTDKGVMRFDGSAFELFTNGVGSCNKIIKDIKADSYGNTWFATLGKGIYRYSGDSFISITKNEGLLSDIVWCFEEDGNGNLWIGSANGGVNKLKIDGIKHITSKDGLSSESIYPVIERKNGEIWAGTLYGGIVKFDYGFFQEYTTEDGLPENITYAICEGPDNNLWLAFENKGIARFDGSVFTHYRNISGLHSQYIETLATDHQGNIWIGTINDLAKFDGKEFTCYKSEGNGLPASFLLHDNKKRTWFGGSLEGLNLIVDNQLYYFTPGSGFLFPEIQCAFQDSYGNIWFGLTKNGICRFNGSMFIYISSKDGLVSDMVKTIVEDKNKNIWLGTDKGINVLKPGFDRNGKPVSYSVKTLERSDGLNGLEFRSLLNDRNNNLWAATGKGLTIIDLNEFTFQTGSPEITLDNVLINQEFIDYKQISDTSYLRSISFGIFLKNSFDSVPAFYNFPLGLKLPHHLNHLTFTFNAKDWAAPHKIRYRYRIEGIDKNWNDLNDNGIADYRNIPSGRHTIVAQAIGGAGIWSNEFRYSFSIRSPWWFSWYAYAFYVFVAIFIIMYYRKLLLKREREKGELKLRQVEINKMKELDEHKSRFFANISHEFRTPLSLILGSIDEIDKLSLPAKNAGQPLKVMRNNSKRLARLVNQLLELSKLDEGKMKLKLIRGNIHETLKFIKASYDSAAERKRIKFLFNIPQNIPIIYWDPEKLEIILHNLLSNAFRFTPEYGKITLNCRILKQQDKPAECTFMGRLLFIEIADTGPGIDNNKLDRLFVRFEKLTDNNILYREGMGIGLALTKELIDFQRGTIKVESAPEKGTTFTVYLPCDAEGFNNAEIIEQREVTGPDTANELYDHLMPEMKGFEENPEVPEKDFDNDRKTILVAEDNQDMLQFLNRKLSGNYRVELTTNGVMAWKKTLEILPDLIVTDLMMPELDGMGLCMNVKKDLRTSHIPLIILTAKATVESRIAGLKTGADDYLEKPFKAEELLVRIENLIIQRQKLKNKYIRMIGFDTDRIEVTGMDEAFLKNALSEIEKNLLNSEWSVEKFSETMNMSHSQLFRKIKALTGMSVTDFILSVRLQKASKLLEKKTGTITDIAFQAGFNDASYFTKCFKKQFKVSPRSYALKFKNR
ncbi:MAG: response regulator [Bacteroidales bacterium]|nr:response regulator [Bacteroidales bacterium]